MCEALRPEPSDQPLAHTTVQAVFDWLPADTHADTTVVAAMRALPEPEAKRLLDELEAAGVSRARRGRCTRSAPGVIRRHNDS